MPLINRRMQLTTRERQLSITHRNRLHWVTHRGGLAQWAHPNELSVERPLCSDKIKHLVSGFDWVRTQLLGNIK